MSVAGTDTGFEPIASRVGIFSVWRPIDHHRQTGSRRLILQLLTPSCARLMCHESTLHVACVTKYFAAHENATIQMVFRAAGRGWRIGFKFLHEPGRYWPRQWRDERPTGGTELTERELRTRPNRRGSLYSGGSYRARKLRGPSLCC